MKLIFTRRAARQLDQILDDLFERNPQAALHFGQRMQQVLQLLVQHPNAGSVTDRPGTRRAVTTPYPYLIFYRLREDAVIIQNVRHAARRPL